MEPAAAAKAGTRDDRHRPATVTQSWKITAYAPRETVEAALLAHEDVLDWDPEIVIAGSELATIRPAR